MEQLALYLPVIAATIVAFAGYWIARASHARFVERASPIPSRSGGNSDSVADHLDEILKAESALAEALKEAGRIEHAAASSPRIMERL